MIVVLISEGVVEHVISVDSMDDLRDYYPQHELREQVGDETIGWTFDGVSFTPPQG